MEAWACLRTHTHISKADFPLSCSTNGVLGMGPVHSYQYNLLPVSKFERGHKHCYLFKVAFLSSHWAAQEGLCFIDSRVTGLIA